MNKLQGYGTSFDGWEKWGDICVISPQSQNYFWLCFFLLYISQWDERIRDKFLSLSLPLPVSSLHLQVHLLQAFFCWKFLQHTILLSCKVCFLYFYTCLHAFFGWLLIRVVPNHYKCFIFMNSCLIEMEYQGFEAV